MGSFVVFAYTQWNSKKQEEVWFLCKFKKKKTFTACLVDYNRHCNVINIPIT